MDRPDAQPGLRRYEVPRQAILSSARLTLKPIFDDNVNTLSIFNKRINSVVAKTINLVHYIFCH